MRNKQNNRLIQRKIFVYLGLFLIFAGVFLFTPALLLFIVPVNTDLAAENSPEIIIAVRILMVGMGLFIIARQFFWTKPNIRSEIIGDLKRNRVNIIVAIISLCMTLFFVEVILRQFYRPVEPLQLGEIVAWGSPEYAAYTPPPNELGFREDELSEDVFVDGTVRILFLGDSFTFGQGVTDGAKRFSDLIESRLNTELEANYHIYNAGVPNTESTTWIDYFKQLYPLYKPHHIFVIFFLRDGTSLCTSLRCYDAVINSLKTTYTKNYFYDHFYLGKFIGNTLVQLQFSNFYNDLLINSYVGSEDSIASWQREQQALLELQKLSRQHGLELHLIIFPVLYRLDEGYPFYEVEDEIIRFATEVNMPVYSLTPGFMGYPEHTLWVSANDQHPNEKGHRIAADTLYPYVKEIVSGTD